VKYKKIKRDLLRRAAIIIPFHQRGGDGVNFVSWITPTEMHCIDGKLQRKKKSDSLGNLLITEIKKENASGFKIKHNTRPGLQSRASLSLSLGGFSTGAEREVICACRISNIMRASVAFPGRRDRLCCLFVLRNWSVIKCHTERRGV
jgi:hypothetical protein